MLAEYTLQDEETQVHGVIVLVDFDGMQFYHIRHFLPHIRRVVHLIQVKRENIFSYDRFASRCSCAI